MKEVSRRAIERISELQPQDWAALAARAQAYRVGGDVWEIAWLAARAGHAAGIAAQSRAILAGAPALAAAAIAGAVAACEAREAVDAAQFCTLSDPVGSAIEPSSGSGQAGPEPTPWINRLRCVPVYG